MPENILQVAIQVVVAFDAGYHPAVARRPYSEVRNPDAEVVAGITPR